MSENEMHLTPKVIYDHLNTYIYGQEAAKKTAATMLYNHINGRRRCQMFIGPSGCGKTEIFRALKKLYPDIYITESRLSQDGWSGSRNVTNLFSEMEALNIDAGNAIVVLDEFDKLITPKYAKGGENVSASVQSELLYLIEGNDVATKDAVWTTSGMSFAFLGAFTSLYEEKQNTADTVSIGFGSDTDAETDTSVTMDDIIGYGLTRELAGRISRIVTLDPMDENGFLSIMDNPNISPLARCEQKTGVKLKLSEKTKKKLVKEAVLRQMGVRYLNAKIEELFDEKLFENENLIKSSRVVDLG